jgi:hypothetical protein
MEDTIIDEYFEALKRLKNNLPIRIPIGSKINNDNVSLEAGRKKGTIKKSRPIFEELIEEIILASSSKTKELDKLKINIEKYKTKYKEQKELYEASLNRELMYLEKINELEK